MSATEEQMAPGCFGAASVYSMDSVVCQGCVAFTSCGDTAIKKLEQMRELVDVRDLLARHAAARVKAQNVALKPPAAPAPLVPSPIPVAQPKPTLQPVERKTTSARVTFEISEDDQNVLALIGEKSVKTREQAIVLCKTNKINNMRSMLPQGVNPFIESGPKFLSVACDLLLLNGGFTKATLKARLIADLAWTDGTAGSHVAIACALLYSFKIITADTSGAFILNPALGRDNTVLSNNERKAA